MIQALPGSSGLAPDSLDGSFGEWWQQATELMQLLFSNSPEPPPFHLQNCLVRSSKLRACMSQGQADILDSGAGPPSGPYELMQSPATLMRQLRARSWMSQNLLKKWSAASQSFLKSQ